MHLMKKFLVLILALVMCLGCFTACMPEEQNPENPGNDETPTLATAADLLYSLYKDSAKENKGDYELVGNIKIGSTDFPVTWAVDTDLITIKASTKTTGFWTVVLPAKNDTKVDYKLTATIKDAAGNTATKSFDRTIGVYDSSEIVSEPVEGVAYKLFLDQVNNKKILYATAATQDNANKFIIGDVDPKKGIDFFAEKVEGGYKFYTTINDAKMYLNARAETADDGKVSKFIGYAAESSNVWYYKNDVKAWFVTIDGLEYVLGTYNAFNTFCMSDASFMKPDTTGVSQFPGNFITKENAEKKGIVDNSGNFDDGQVVTLEKFLEAADACEDKGTPSKEKYIIEGKIVEVENPQYGNVYIENEAGTKVYVYGMNDTQGNKYDKMSYKPQVGDTVKLYGSAGKYNKPQMPNAILISVTKGEGGDQGGTTPTPPATGTLTAVSAPVEGTAYKLFLVQVSLNKTLFATKEISGGKYYVGTENAAEGLDFYAEIVTGGYKFYTTIDGAKMYLNAYTVASTDGYPSKRLSFEASTENVWYYKADCNAWFVMIDGAEYVLGTYGTYNTFCISDASFMKPDTTGVTQFPGLFVTKEEAEAAGGNQGGTTPTPPANATSIADIKAAADGEFTAAGVVVGVNAQSFLLKDDTGLILVYFGYSWTPDVAIGDKLTVTGTTSEFAGVKQFGNKPAIATYTKTGTETVTHPTATVLTVAEMDAYLTMETVAPLFIKMTGVLSVSQDKYFNLTVAGASIAGSITYPIDVAAVKALDGQTIEVEGYITGVAGSSTKYLNLMVTSINGTAIGGGNQGGDDSGDQGGTTPTPPVSGGNVCDFAGLTVSTSYAAEQTTTSGWVAKYASYQNPQVLGFNVLVLNGKTATVGSLTSPTLAGGITALTFKYTNVFNENNGVDITINIYQDGQVVATTTLDDDSVTKGTAETFTWTLDTAIEGEFVIEIVNNCPTQNANQNKDRVALWDIAWVSNED